MSRPAAADGGRGYTRTRLHEPAGLKLAHGYRPPAAAVVGIVGAACAGGGSSGRAAGLLVVPTRGWCLERVVRAVSPSAQLPCESNEIAVNGSILIWIYIMDLRYEEFRIVAVSLLAQIAKNRVFFI